MRKIACVLCLALAAVLTACGPSVTSAPAPAGSASAASPVITPSAAPRVTLSPSAAATATASGPTRVHDPGVVTGTITGPCHAAGRLPAQRPDPHCTPGSYDPAQTAAKICAPGYSTKSYRAAETGLHGTTRFKYDVAYPAYGVASGTRTELDHLISLELGGSNDAANLWPEQPPVPNPKDTVENALHAWVCDVAGAAAELRLARAQRAIATDWVTAEKVLGIASQA